MTVEQMVSLATSGFSLNQIKALESISLTRNQAPQTSIEPTAKPEQDALTQEIQRLTSLVQNQNIIGTPMPASQTTPMTAEDALASIINPPKQEVK